MSTATAHNLTNPAQRVADLVRHSGRHLTQGGQAVPALQQAIFLAQLAAEVLDLLLELIVRLLEALGDLAVGHDDPAQLFDALRARHVDVCVRRGRRL